MRTTSVRIVFASVSSLVLCGAAAQAIAARPSRAPELITAQPSAAWRIALTTNREGDSEIYSMNADGSHVRRLTHSPKFDFPGPWSPDGRRMLFYSQRSGADVWVMNADGTRQRNLTRNPAADGGGSWSPDGRRIVFDTDRDGNGEIYAMNADGSGQRHLASSPSTNESRPGWSPDGRSIAFVTDRDGNAEIYAMNADGSNPRNLTRSPGNDGGISGAGGWFVWSPEGRYIAFPSTRDTRDEDNSELYVMNADGSRVRRVTRAPGVERLLSWSPDGRKLAFTRDTSKPRWAFFVMNVDGSGVRKVDWTLPRGG